MKLDVLGVKINTDTKNTILFLIKKLLGEDRKVFIVTPYSEMLVAAQKDLEFKNTLNSANFALPDGIGVLWAAKFLQLTTYNLLLKIWYLIITLGAVIFYPKYILSPIPERIPGSDFVWDLARLAADRGYSIFLLGGYGDTAEKAAEALRSKYPNLNVAGTSTEITTDIHADFLFVALGPVRQEKWIAENLPKMAVKLAIGLGGTFDYLASKRLLAPQIWRQTGLEWLWRLLTQPWRLFRITKGVLGLIWYTVRANI